MMRPPPDPDHLSDGERYRLGDVLGRGGMAVVRVATDRRLRRELAIKSLSRANDRRARERFVEEAQITGQLQHPNIVPVHELGFDGDGHPFLAMKRVVGRNFAEVIGAEHKGRKQCPVHRWPALRSMLDIVVGVCDAMAFAHSRGVIHRDLKPQNVMVGEFGEVLVVDWGLAKPIRAPIDDRAAAVTSDRRAARDHLTQAGTVTGTPAFMAPEQAGGFTAQHDEGVDIYAIGGILYAVLTCVPPIGAGTPDEQIEAVVQHRIKRPSRRRPRWGIPAELEAICLKALERRRRDRYRTVAEMRSDIKAYLNDLPVSAARYRLRQRISRWVRHHPTLTIASSLVAVFLAVGAIGIMAWQAQLAAERERVRTEESARLRAEQSAIREMVERARWEDLARHFGTTMRQQRDETVEEFRRWWSRLKAGGMHEGDVMATVSRADGTRFLAAFDRLFAAHEAAPAAVPVTADDWMQRGALRYAFRNLEGSIEDFTRALEFEGEHHAQVLTLRGISLNGLDRHREALADFDSALRLDPASRGALGNRALTFDLLDETATAIGAYTELLRRYPDDVGGLLGRAACHERTGSQHLALADYSAALGFAPDDLEILGLRVNLFLRQGRTAEALDDLHRMAELKPDAWRVLRNIAVIQGRAGEQDAAIKALRQAYRHCDEQESLEEMRALFRQYGVDPH